ncbi:MAG TPA: amylo-alpha-1,6-glucosidase [Terriglobales bacterium]|nr:amylo-alpha-1,6-glucosidase [Terriglobales bacterium]
MRANKSIPSLYAHAKDTPDRRVLDSITRDFSWDASGGERWKLLLSREWLVTNGLGGYASGTVGGTPTRRFHGFLIAALPNPHGRTMMLNDLTEELVLADRTTAFLRESEPDKQAVAAPLQSFRLEAGIPVWTFKVQDRVLEKRVHLVHRQNTTHITYTWRGPDSATLRLGPAVHFRPHEGKLSGLSPRDYSLSEHGGWYQIGNDSHVPLLRMATSDREAKFVSQEKEFTNLQFQIEKARGYDYTGALWSPGYFEIQLAAPQQVTLTASTEDWDILQALDPDEAFHAEMERRRRLIGVGNPALRDSFGGELALAADQFLIVPEGRTSDAARARASGDEIRTVIAGYHWFTDWGRDTMISLEGLTLATGRHADAGYILRTFAHYVRDGLIPNMFPEGKTDGLYHTADATLWFFHAVQRYLDYTGDRATLRLLLPQLCRIVDCHLQGTRFGIGVDPHDGLLRQGAEGYQLTWMDAKVGDWVVTPRRGKAVEINALWYNALRLLQAWLREERGEAGAAKIGGYADRARDSFNRRFWYEQGQYLYDVVDTERGEDDASLRPNQLFAIALDHPILERSRWQPVLDAIENQLLTPVGLRSLAPGSPDYKPRYDGDLRARDAAYHQGTVWAWLIGPFVDAYLKVHPDDPQQARKFLKGFQQHLSEGCIGSVSEIFDAEPPFHPRGCIAQAWSVAELVRCWVKTSGLTPEPGLSGLHFAGERAGG